ncbi:MAG: hypothetical protein KBD73_02405 [Candidatus Magasanikbacteria bacterium]|nr:hypothetical protein [Candidatus Magasanikbacteria bacterium]
MCKHVYIDPRTLGSFKIKETYSILLMAERPEGANYICVRQIGTSCSGGSDADSVWVKDRSSTGNSAQLQSRS